MPRATSDALDGPGGIDAKRAIEGQRSQRQVLRGRAWTVSTFLAHPFPQLSCSGASPVNEQTEGLREES
jgi:hypothetical protein